jgi:uncharacterized membrane protein YeaQ/YmgE (transglycosylase-associated protein family)
LPSGGRGDNGPMDIGTIIWLVIVGLIVGALGRLVSPGKDPMGWLLTIGIGVASVVLAGWLLGDALGFWGYVIAVVIAAILVSLVGRFWGADRDRRVAA